MSKRILLAAGGTGGHIIPAISFGSWIGENHPHVDVVYMCGSRSTEVEIYRSHGIEPIITRASGSPLGAAGLRKKIGRTIEMFASCLHAMRIFSSLAVDSCAAFGGYVSVAAMLAAKWKRKRLIFHEQNAGAGRATRMASWLGASVASGWEVCEPFSRGSFIFTGTPTRKFSLCSREEAWVQLHLPGRAPDGPIVVAMTGTLGSDNVRDILCSLSARQEFDGWTFLSVTNGLEEPERVNDGLYLVPQMWDPSPLFSAADRLISRGGGSTLAEIDALGLPCVSVPWRGAAQDHQMKNAMTFARGDKNRSLWDEKSEGVDSLAQKLGSICKFSSQQDARRIEIRDKMYNKIDDICRRIWDLLALNSTRMEDSH